MLRRCVRARVPQSHAVRDVRPYVPCRRLAKAAEGGDFIEEPEGWADDQKKKGGARRKKPSDSMNQMPVQKPKTQRRLEKEAESNLAYQTLVLAPGEHAQFNMVASTMLFRKPVIFPNLTRWEMAWYTLQEKRRKEEFRRVNPLKKGVEEPPDIPRNLRPADRVTPADRANDRKTTDRRLDQFIFLLVKKNRSEHPWQFPRVVVPDGEVKLRHHGQAAMMKLVGDGPLVFFDTNAPCAHIFYRYGAEHRTGKSGALEFFYRAELLKGAITELKDDGIVDWLWAAPDELPQYLSASLYRAVADAMPPVLGAKEDPAFNLVPPPERKAAPKPSRPASPSPSSSSSPSPSSTKQQAPPAPAPAPPAAPAAQT